MPTNPFKKLHQSLLAKEKNRKDGIKRCVNNKKVTHSSIFSLFRWLESSNIHKLAILRFTNRVLLENRPADIAARLRSVLVYQSDHKPYIGIDTVALLSKERIVAERRFWKADVPLLKVNPLCKPNYPHLYPYNLTERTVPEI